MAFPIESDSVQVSLWVGALRTDFALDDLAGVDDDNTLAESGVYNSYHNLRAAVGELLRALNDDASNIGAAGMSYEEADAASARRF